MKQIIGLFFLTTILISCNSVDKKENSIQESVDNNIELVNDSVEYIEINSDEALIATALMAAPEASRAGCKVIGFNMAGEFVTLREGNNEFICVADNPNRPGFNAACYHKDLEPFMARGRALRVEGKTDGEIFEIREEEAKSGKLSMGKDGSTLHIYFGAKSQYDPETSEVLGAQYRYVVYMPWATAASTGLPESPIAPNHPWIMNPGTHRAHIMISPLKDAN